MSSILSGDTESRGTRGTDDGDRNPVVRAFKMALSDTGDGEDSARGGRVVRPYLLVDLGEAMNYLRGRRRTSGVTEALTRLAAESSFADSERRSEFADVELESESDEGGGRGVLSKLFLLGLAIGLGYVIRRRSGSVGEAVGRATDRVREAADETERRSGEMAGRTETAAGEAADRIEETGDAVADRVESGSEEAAETVREGGEQAADEIEETGETAANVEEEAADSAEEMTDDEE